MESIESVFLFFLAPIAGALCAELIYWRMNRKSKFQTHPKGEMGYWLDERLDDLVSAMFLGWCSAFVVGGFDFNLWLSEVTGVENLELTNHGFVFVISFMLDYFLDRFKNKKA